MKCKVKVKSGDDKKEEEEGYTAKFAEDVKNGVYSDFILKCE